MTNFLNCLLKNCCLHVFIQRLFILLLLVEECVDASILHFLLGCSARWVFGDFLDNLQHSFKRVQHESVGCVSEVDSCNCEHNDDPDRPGQVYRSFRLNLTPQAVGDFKLNILVRQAYKCSFLVRPVVLRIRVYLAFVRVNLDYVVVPGSAFRVGHTHADDWVNVLS